MGNDSAIANLSHQVAVMAAAVRGLSNTVATTLADVKPAPLAPSNSTELSSSNHALRVRLLPQLDRNQYKNVTHWGPELYKKLRKASKKTKPEDGEADDPSPKPGTSKKRSRPSNDESPVTSCFMEDDQGGPIPLSQKNAVRLRARSFFHLLLERKKAPATAEKVDMESKDEFISIMEENYFFLRLCENHWKSEQVFRTYYPPWHDTHVKKPQREGVINVDDDSDQEKPSKRPRTGDSDASFPNHPRMGEAKSTPPPRPAPKKITTKRKRVCTLGFLDCIHY